MRYPVIEFVSDSASNYVVSRLIAICGFITQPIRFRLFYRMSRRIGAFVNSEQICVLRFSDDADFCFYLADPYWNRLIYRNFRYEPEIEAALRLVSDVDYTFLDLGANFGYWSVLVSSKLFGSRPVIAVEPVANNYDMLSRNWSVNNKRFTIRKKAITQGGDGEVLIQTNPRSISNVDAQIVSPQLDISTDFLESVASTSVDDLCFDEGCSGKPLVIKLDVEGMEIDALKGSKNTLKNPVLLIYEDHGKDEKCCVTNYILELGFIVYYFDNKYFRIIMGITDAKNVKKRKTKGYNFFAVQEGTEFAHAFLAASSAKN